MSPTHKFGVDVEEISSTPLSLFTNTTIAITTYFQACFLQISSIKGRSYYLGSRISKNLKKNKQTYESLNTGSQTSVHRACLSSVLGADADPASMTLLIMDFESLFCFRVLPPTLCFKISSL